MSHAARALDRIFRAEFGPVLATLIRLLGDFQLAEDALQDAFTAALETWCTDGVPAKPSAWLTTTARRKAVDRLRHLRIEEAKSSELALSIRLEREAYGAPADADVSPVPDDQLRLIFTCCHPALSREAQVALTLRTLGGLHVDEIAQAFLVRDLPPVGLRRGRGFGVDGGDRALDLVRAGPPHAERALDEPSALGDGRARAREVALVEDEVEDAEDGVEAQRERFTIGDLVRDPHNERVRRFVERRIRAPCRSRERAAGGSSSLFAPPDRARPSVERYRPAARACDLGPATPSPPGWGADRGATGE